MRCVIVTASFALISFLARRGDLQNAFAHETWLVEAVMQPFLPRVQILIHIFVSCLNIVACGFELTHTQQQQQPPVSHMAECFLYIPSR